MIKVLHVVVDNHIGGIQNRILNIGHDLRNGGIESIILSPKGDGDFAKIARNSGFNVHQASIESPKLFHSSGNILKNVLWICKFPLGVFETIRVIKRENVEIVHVNGLLALHAVVAARITGTPLIWHLVSTIYPPSLVSVIRPIYRRWAKKIVFITHNTIEYYLGDSYNQDRIRVIFEPVDVTIFDKRTVPISRKEEIYQQYGFTSECKVIGFVGNINPQKGLEGFIKIAKELKQVADYKLKFLIVGGASPEHNNYLRKLEELVETLGLKDEVIFTGKVPDLRGYLSVMDIFLMTSISEGTPLVILEAMSMEIPVVAPDVGGIAEQICDGKTGFIVPPKDVETTFTCLQALLNNFVVREEMGKSGRERVSSLFSLEKCIQEHEKLYLETVYQIK